MQRNNYARILSDVVSVDAWHNELGSEHPRADLHVDVTFGVGRFGAEESSPVRFRLSLKNAEIVVVIPETEPVRVDPSSVSRDHVSLRTVHLRTVEQSSGVDAGTAAGVHLSNVTPRARLGGSFSANITHSESDKLTVERRSKDFSVTQSITEDGFYRWRVSPYAGSDKLHLDGKPWDATSYPRLRLIDCRDDPSSGIPPAVHVEIRAHREDLHISELELKDRKRWDIVKQNTSSRNKIAAAEAYIRDVLSREGLYTGPLDEKFAYITIANVISQST